jgi:hypothetical protein
MSTATPFPGTTPVPIHGRFRVKVVSLAGLARFGPRFSPGLAQQIRRGVGVHDQETPTIECGFIGGVK